MFTQEPLQFLSPGTVHIVVHMLLEHTCPVAQRIPQPPQLLPSLAVSTHVPPQFWRGKLQIAHRPPEHAEPAPHTRPQAPQLFGSVRRSTQVPLHNACPGLPLHTWVHRLDEHVLPVPHAMPQPPQLFGSVVMSTHAPLQLVVPMGQRMMQDRIEHTSGDAHALKHAPQLLGSVSKSTQRSPQRLNGSKHGGSAHIPPMHVVPGRHAFPHPPQFAGSDDVSVQIPRQFVCLGSGQRPGPQTPI